MPSLIRRVSKLFNRKPESAKTSKKQDSMATTISTENTPIAPSSSSAHALAEKMGAASISAVGIPEVRPAHPAAADLRTEICQPLPTITALVDPSTLDSEGIIASLLAQLHAALEADDVHAVKRCFFPGQSYWRDVLALTYHTRTFSDAGVVAPALLERHRVHKIGKFGIAPGTARCVPAMPTLTWIDCFFGFETAYPAALCGGMLQLLPEVSAEDGSITWKIWTFTTWINELSSCPMDESRLRTGTGGKPLDISNDADKPIETDVFIVGAGNAGLVLAARLKALGVEYLVMDRCAKVGDNWAKRYDAMRLHVYNGFAQTPYLTYPADAPEPLTRDALASQMVRYAKELELNVLLLTTVTSTSYDASAQKWTLQLETPNGRREVVCRQLVQATGVGSQAPYVPRLEKEAEYKGIKMHSAEFKNGKMLAEKAKSVIVVGSANTAFDVMQDCHGAGLQVTMIQRSPTYVIPMEYFKHPQGVGMYETGLPVDVVDCVIQGGPVGVGSQLVQGVHVMQAMAEPDRYAALEKAGFLLDKSGNLLNNLFERAGGHYVDFGGAASLLATGKVGIKAGVSPVSYTASGLRLSDGSELSADAIIFCTGYKDVDVQKVVPSILGTGSAALIGDKMDTTWGLDREGEIRGIWKRHEKVDNFWTMGGFLSQHRFWSKFLAIQIKAKLDGTLPDAYRDTPAAV